MPDMYAGWNLISSVGSFISLSGAILFIYLIIKAFIDKAEITGNATPINEFLVQNAPITQGADAPLPQLATLEWLQMSPPVNHTYLELPFV